MALRVVDVGVAKSLRSMAKRGEMLSARDNVIALANTVVEQAEQIAILEETAARCRCQRQPTS